MTTETFQLSIEELAFAMGVLGGAETAGGFLLATLGDIPQEEMEARLLAASHSLIAREYLSPEGEEKRLDETLAGVIRVLIQNRFTIRCSRSESGQEQVLTYFCGEQSTVECGIFNEVACRLEVIPGQEDAEERSHKFFGLPEGVAPQGQNGALGTVPVRVLEGIKDAIPGPTKEEIIAQFVDAALPAGLAEELAEDFLSAEFRGSTIRIENENDQMVANEGFLILKGPQRFWVFELIPQDPPLANVFRGTDAQFRDSYRKLLANR